MIIISWCCGSTHRALRMILDAHEVGRMACKARAMSGTAVRCTVHDALSVLAAPRGDTDIISGFL